MFTGGLKECEMTRVKLQGVCPTTMARLMYFMYTGQIRVTEITVCSLLSAATMFQVRKQIILEERNIKERIVSMTTEYRLIVTFASIL